MSTPDFDLASWAIGDPDAPAMVFVHPNPLDGLSWAYQVGDFSADHRCVVVDLPGYGRTPPIPVEWGMIELADAIWRAVDRESSNRDPVVVVGCSIGSHLAQHMYHRAPSRVRALVLSGTGWDPSRPYVTQRIREYAERGVAARRQHAFDVLSADFGATELGQFLVDTTCARADFTDAASISRLFEIRSSPDPEEFITTIAAPTLVISGTEDAAHPAARPLVELLPAGRLHTIKGAGHACYLERPDVFDSAMRTFLATLSRTSDQSVDM